ncbi:hypothetical protein DQ04_04961060 [Trypanosoma grayi]|uniref:hypothetical protein n=1 Tax=Trypanosoma grayi TaxID=71804 RepID=UPI0004F44AAD|nr:hypothetical protein DQ04_04961060 [Trypanosoma grayi]KEG09604.1 hypothetical protein DQ04_04961060 [Trypanosoma grayi]
MPRVARLLVCVIVAMLALHMPRGALGTSLSGEELSEALPGSPQKAIGDTLLASMLQSVIDGIIGNARVDLGGTMMPKNSSWVKLNGWIIGVSVVLSILFVVSVAATVCVIRNRKGGASSNSSGSGEETQEEDESGTEEESESD